MKRTVWVLLLPALVISGCSSGPETITFDTPLPSCDAFVATLTDLGMPGGAPKVQAQSSASPTGLNCVYSPAEQADPPALAAATVQVSRPNVKSDEQDPRERFGSLLADTDCTGTADTNPELPGGASCYELIADTTATATVSAVTRQSGIRASVIWTDPTASPEQLKTDSLAKANALAEAVIAKL